MANINEIDATQKIKKFKKGQQAIKGIHNKEVSDEETAERAALKKQIKNAKPINISDGKEIKIPEGKLAAVELGPDHLDGTGINVNNLKYEMALTHEKYEKQWLQGLFGTSDQAMFTDITTSVNKNYAQENNILFFSAVTNQFTDFNADTNKRKLITGDVNFASPVGPEYLKRAIEAAKMVDVAYIPICIQGVEMGHEVTLVKQGHNWAFIDQYAFDTPVYASQKRAIWDIMNRNIPRSDKKTTNMGNIYNNTTNSCVLFSEVMGKMALSGEYNMFNEIEYLNKTGLPMRQEFIRDKMELEQYDFVERAMQTEIYLQKYHNYQADR